MEDSLVFNRTSLERGLFRSMSLKKYSSSITKNQDTSGDDKFMKPPPDKTDRIKNGQYEKMNEKGIVPEETRITNGDAILGKVTPINTTTNNGKIFKDSSEQYKSHADGVIDRVHVGIKNQDGYETRKVLVRSERFPYIGDKFCFRNDLGVEVYTDKGWKLLKDITVDDSVAILVDDEKYTFENPVGVYSFEYDGDVVGIRSDNVDIDVTIDHELYVKVDDNPHFTLERSDALLKSKVYFKHNAYDEKGVKMFDDETIPDISRVNMRNESKLYNYQGTVSCIEVRTHVFMARYNGKPLWIGNCSRHGQKGTMGIGLRSIDMPFTKHGVRPDIIVNPNAIPSRMTIGQLWECLLGKLGGLKGKNMDGTAFEDYDINAVKDMLEKLGYQRECEEFLYNGMTGKKIKNMIFIGPTYYQRLKHMTLDKIHCVKDDTEVLTIDGWKPVSDITTQDKVATLVNDELKYENPLEIQSYSDYNGSMYYVKNDSIDLAVTGNHRLWAKVAGKDGAKDKFVFVRADELIGQPCTHKRNANWVADYVPQFVLPATDTNNEKLVDMDSFLTILGIWFAEGWTVDETQSGRIQISVENPSVLNALVHALEKIGLEYTINEDELEINDQQLYEYVNSLNVKIPDWVLELNNDQSRIFIDSMIMGNDVSEYSTTSRETADRFQQLCLHAGWVSVIKTESVLDGDTNEEYVLFECSVVKTNTDSEVNKKENKRDTKVDVNVGNSDLDDNSNNENLQDDLIVKEKCHVYCLTVPSGIFYVRRNGKACWTGNSRSRGPVTILVHQAPEGKCIKLSYLYKFVIIV